MISSNFVLSVKNSVINAVIGAGIGYLATRTVTSLNPQTGLIFGALYGAVKNNRHRYL
jgi:hypothetical protein